MSAKLERVPAKSQAVRLLSVVALALTTVLTSQALEPSSSTSGSINGHEWVDLGLSVKWASCNVGARNMLDDGNYYAWGETSTKSTYTRDNSETNCVEITDIAGTSRDVARREWGGTWRLPTKAEMQELVDKCAWGWTELGGGYMVTGPNGNNIFLPAEGGYAGPSLMQAGSGGLYWSSTPVDGATDCACMLIFTDSSYDVYWCHRYFGLSVRPVTE